MKKILFVGSLLLALALPCLAQNPLELEISYTPSLTFFRDQAPTPNPDPDVQYSLTYGSDAAFRLVYSFNAHLSVASGVGLAWVNQSYSINADGQSSAPSAEYIRQQFYLRVPFHIRWKTSLGSTERWQLFMSVGPHLDVLLSATGRTADGTTYTDDQGNPILNNAFPINVQTATYHPVVLGASGEIGLRYAHNDKWGLFFALQTSFSITDPGGQGRYNLIFYNQNYPKPTTPALYGSLGMRLGLYTRF